ncbi:hypothetical protein GQX74_000318 [Glossina fuscipes]|nr:hypothetical protein GQX74_000318 [Glossina fuscipes]
MRQSGNRCELAALAMIIEILSFKMICAKAGLAMTKIYALNKQRIIMRQLQPSVKSKHFNVLHLSQAYNMFSNVYVHNKWKYASEIRLFHLSVAMRMSLVDFAQRSLSSCFFVYNLLELS